MVCPRSHWACHSDAAGDSWRFGVLSGCCFSEPRCHAPKITQGSPKRELPGRIEYEHEHRPPGRAEHEHDETQSSAAFCVSRTSYFVLRTRARARARARAREADWGHDTLGSSDVWILMVSGICVSLRFLLVAGCCFSETPAVREQLRCPR